VATVKATDVISGMQLVGLTTDLSEGGCRRSTRKGPFSEGTRILLEITKNDVSLLTNATVVYNLKDKFMGISFEENAARPSGYPCRLDKSGNRSGQLSPDFDVIDALRCPNCDALFERGRVRVLWGEIRADKLMGICSSQ
jgi:hypothetical protein